MQRCIVAWKSRRVVQFERDSIYSVAYWHGTFPGRQDARRRGAVSATQATPRARTHTHTLTHGHCVSAKESREVGVGAPTSFLSLLRFACSAPQIKDRIRWTSGRVSRSRIREKPPPPPEKRRKTGERHEEAGKRAKKVF